MLLLVNKLHFRLLGFTPRRSLSSSLTLIVNSTIVMPSRFVTAASHQFPLDPFAFLLDLDLCEMDIKN